ncbi:ATP-binding protein [Candidatus Roizmanbacteria bacterium]|nr:ATP-binding protein [Candidatus Roizmanbacteria bacterium]
MIPRIYDNLTPHLQDNKVLILYGPRRVGKTVLLQNYVKTCGLKYRFDTGEDISVQHVFNSQSKEIISQYAKGFELLIIDEAQTIEHIGKGLKLAVDTIPGIKIIATGSASFDLANKVGEPLTGRQKTLFLYPVSQMELLKNTNSYDIQKQKEEYMVYGSYPEVLTLSSSVEKQEYLRGLVNSYILKDILTLEQVKGSKVLLDLLRLLAFQMGNEVSYSELSKQLSIDGKTVARYLDLLEKAFVIVNLRGYSSNLRKEITKKSKYYFLDNGIRNAIISNFNPLELRDDVGRLWENFLVMERLKKQSYTKIIANNYFWRTWNQQEVDWVEEREGNIFGYEFKWSANKKVSPPSLWKEGYPKSSFTIINSENYLEFIG